MSSPPLWKSLCCIVPLLFFASATIGLPGCREKKETVIDIETPNSDIEVERSKKDGSLDIKVKRKSNDDTNE